ncbi:hypothetical protein FB446DRAFT_700641 [Lentinula raphanica]|nr:hypothetical protein FB446DRAFT_700641 [Lentinula raphanica]
MTHSTASRVLAILFVGAAISSSGVLAAPTPLPYIVYHPPPDQSSNGQGSLPVGHIPARTEHTMDTANPTNGGPMTEAHVHSSHPVTVFPIRQKPETAQLSDGGSTFNAGTRVLMQSSNEQGGQRPEVTTPHPPEVGNAMLANDGSILPKDHEDTVPLTASREKQKALLDTLKENLYELETGNFEGWTDEAVRNMLEKNKEVAENALKGVPKDVRHQDVDLWKIKKKAEVLLLAVKNGLRSRS